MSILASLKDEASYLDCYSCDKILSKEEFLEEMGYSNGYGEVKIDDENECYVGVTSEQEYFAPKYGWVEVEFIGYEGNYRFGYYKKMHEMKRR